MIVADAPLFAPEKILEGFHRALRRGVDAVVCNHVSNVFGCVQPVEAIAQLCRRYNTPLIVDASQSAGILPVTLSDWGAAFVAMPGHKGLYGPQGMGLLLCGGEASPLLFGGTGSASRMQTMPPDLPDRLEAGTHNMPGIAGLLEGLRFVARMGTENIADHEIRLTRRAARGLAALPGVEVFADGKGQSQTGVLSFRVLGMDSEQIGEELARRQIAVRSGLHCAPLAHRTAGTLETGTVRLSPSVFNTPQHIDTFLRELTAILRENESSGSRS
ncbi:MAG: aminotransferase class V-fold PLP-dependent enzyme [Oscillospiraceae bacterium]